MQMSYSFIQTTPKLIGWTHIGLDRVKWKFPTIIYYIQQSIICFGYHSGPIDLRRINFAIFLKGQFFPKKGRFSELVAFFTKKNHSSQKIPKNFLFFLL